MVKYFSSVGFLKGTWDQVSTAFWQRYPNPYSNHVLTEDIIFREVTPDSCLISRRLLTKTSRAPRWAENFLPTHKARKAYIIEDSIVDPQSRTMITLTWNITHTYFMSVEERCLYSVNSDNSNCTEVKREAWISSNLYGLSKPVQVKRLQEHWQRPPLRRPERKHLLLKRKLKTWRPKLRRINTCDAETTI
ncbi:PRELI domain containing 1a isoform X2 [Brachyhypopomus gauderio]|uniref:PRELI domain containing 1a isoform X2 n=1 Tax=Brachyhypopomus gauderio TaxID=698409 RepID=UPI00404102F5